MRQQLGKFESRFSVLLKLKLRSQQLGLLPDKRQPQAFPQVIRDQFTRQLLKLWFVVKQIQMRWCPNHMDKDDVLRPCGNQGWFRAGKQILIEQRRERNRTDPHPRSLKHLSTGDCALVGKQVFEVARHDTSH